MALIQINPSASLSIDEKKVIARSTSGHFQLQGQDVASFVNELLPLINGVRTQEELVNLLPDYSPESVEKLVQNLVDQNVLCLLSESEEKKVQESRIKKAKSKLYKKLNITSRRASTVLSNAHVVIVGLEPWAMNAVYNLAQLGVGKLTLWDSDVLMETELPCIECPSNKYVGAKRHVVARNLANYASLGKTEVISGDVPEAFFSTEANFEYPSLDKTSVSLFIVSANYEEVLLRYHTSKATHEADIPYFSAHIEGNEAWIGPYQSEDEGGCWNCLRLRRLAMETNIMDAHRVQGQLMSQRPAKTPKNWLAATSGLAGKLITEEVARILIPSLECSLKESVEIHDLLNGGSSLHHFTSMPWCPACGGQQAKLDSRDENVALQYDSVETLAELQAQMPGWIDSRLGIIKSLEISPIGPPLPLSGSAKLSSYTEGDTSRVTGSPICGGKGLTPFRAQISSIGETVERYSAARYRDADLVLAKISDLEGEVIDPRRLCHYDKSVYQNSYNPYIPFDPQKPIRWVEGHWFGTTQKVWVPAVACYFGLQLLPQEQILQVSSNGLAAGESTEDASLRATFELLERDATMLSWLAQKSGREIKLDQSLSEGMREMLKYVEGAGTEVKLYLLEAGIDVPVVFCLGFGRGRKSPSVAASLSCHGDLRVAVDKALLELAQVIPYLSTITLDRVPRSVADVKTLEEHAFYYVPDGRESAFDFLNSNEPPILLKDVPEGGFPKDITKATNVISQKLKEAGVKIATVDMTSPDTYHTPFRVARAVGVDLQPIHFGYGLRPSENPRLKSLLGGRPINPNPHPIA